MKSFNDLHYLPISRIIFPPWLIFPLDSFCPRIILPPGNRWMIYTIYPCRGRGRGRWDLASCQVSLNTTHHFTGEVKNVSDNQRPGGLSYFFFSIGLKSTDLSEDVEILLPVKFCWIPFITVSEEKLKMFQPIKGRGGHLVFPIGPKNTNLVEDVEILLPVMFRWIRFSGSRGEVENVSTNQRQGRRSCFSD